MQIILRDYLKEHGISQKELSERSGVTESSISLLVSGQRSGKIITLVKIMTALGCDFDDIVVMRKGDDHGRK